MTIQMYKNNSDENVINKDKKQIKSVNAKLFEPCDILNPILILDASNDLFQCNYIFISKFGRFYFVNNITIINGGMMRLSCSVDALESWWSSLKSIKQNIIRNEKSYNMYMIDPTLQITSRKRRQVVKFAEPDGGNILNANPLAYGHSFVLNSL